MSILWQQRFHFNTARFRTGLAPKPKSLLNLQSASLWMVWGQLRNVLAAWEGLEQPAITGTLCARRALTQSASERYRCVCILTEAARSYFLGVPLSHRSPTDQNFDLIADSSM